MISENLGFFIFFSVVTVISLGLSLKNVISSFLIPKIRSQNYMMMTALIALDTIISTVSWFVDNYSENMYLKYSFSYLTFIMPTIFFGFMFYYICSRTNKGKKLTDLSNIMILLSCVVITVLALTDKLFTYVNGEYHSLELSLIAILYPSFCIITSLHFIQTSEEISKRQRAILSLYFYIPIFGYSADTIICYFANSIRIFFILAMFTLMIIVTLDEYNKIVEQDAKLSQDRIDIMLAQIKPHFLYNTLNSIAGLCIIDPNQARDITLDLSKYLRANLDSLNSHELVPFSRELEHIHAYVNIEKARFQDRIKIKYYTDNTDFLVPALTIQPLVENAIKHGICKNVDGGTVIISSREDTDGWVIKVMDNGVGFDIKEAEKNSDKTHIGIANVRERIESQCEGTLSVKSIIGTGTEVLVYIPKKKR